MYAYHVLKDALYVIQLLTIVQYAKKVITWKEINVFKIAENNIIWILQHLTANNVIKIVKIAKTLIHFVLNALNSHIC